MSDKTVPKTTTPAEEGPIMRTAAAAGAVGGAFGAGALALMASDLWPFEGLPVSLGWGIVVGIGVMVGAYAGRLGGETVKERAKKAGKPARRRSAIGIGFAVGCGATPLAAIALGLLVFIMIV